MAIEYQIKLDEEHVLNYRVDPKRIHDSALLSDAPDWTRLSYNQCTNCPLKGSDQTHCPAALDLYQVVEDFRSLPAFKKVQVWVRSPEREYTKLAGLEEGLRSLVGLIMATSACPVTSELKPMAQHHLPFASAKEFALRSVSTYLLKQYFKSREGQVPDWELKGLVKQFQALQLVNQAFWQRIHDTCEGDSALKAFLTFFSMSTSMTHSLEAQLQSIRDQVMPSYELTIS